VDTDRAVERTPAADQVLQQQYLVTAAGDTFWVQSPTSPTPGTSLVTISDPAPTDDEWNYAAVEVRAASSTAGPSKLALRRSVVGSVIRRSR
jgi:hypothetical protein